MAKEELHYLSEPAIRSQMELTAKQFRILFEGALADLEAMGGDSNERLSSLSMWAAHVIDLAGQAIDRRATEKGAPPLSPALGTRMREMFLADATARAELLGADQ